MRCNQFAVSLCIALFLTNFTRTTHAQPAQSSATVVVSNGNDPWELQKTGTDVSLRGISAVDEQSSTDRSPSKFDYARQLAALVSYMFIRQGDSAGLIHFDSSIRTFLPALGTVAHLRSLLQTLYESQAQTASNTASVLHEAAERIPRRGIVIVISDFLTDVPQLLKSIYHLRHRLHDVILFHVLSEDELTFPFSDVTRFRDLEESFDEMDVDPPAIRRAYLQQFHEYLSDFENGCKRIPCDYVRLSTAQPFEAKLSDYLAKRAGG